MVKSINKLKTKMNSLLEKAKQKLKGFKEGLNAKIIIRSALVFAISIVAILVILSSPIAGGKGVVFAVLSGSMEPKIHTGSIVVVIPAKNYKIGDVITFFEKDKEITVTHRIKDIRKIDGQDVFITKGDANETEDNYPVAKNDVIGKVVFSIPLLGRVLHFANTDIGFVTFIVISATILIYEEVRKIKQEVKDLEKKQKVFTKTKRAIKKKFKKVVKNTKKRLKTIRKTLPFIFTLGILAASQTVNAQTLNINCTNESCVLSPESSPLFSEGNLAPGDFVQRDLEICNNKNTAISLSVKFTDYKNEVPSDFSDKILVSAVDSSDNSLVLNEQTMSELEDKTIELISVGSNSCKTLTFTAKLSNVGNEYQNAKLGFNINWVIEGEDGSQPQVLSVFDKSGNGDVLGMTLPETGFPIIYFVGTGAIFLLIGYLLKSIASDLSKDK